MGDKLGLLLTTQLAQSRYLHRWGPLRLPNLRQSLSRHKCLLLILRPTRCFGITQLRVCYPLCLYLSCFERKCQKFDRCSFSQKFPVEWSYCILPIAAWSVILGSATRRLLLQENCFERPLSLRRNSACNLSYSQWICLFGRCWRHYN
jgi:hypothetical protein